MNKSNRNILFCLILFFCSATAFAQYSAYSYERKLGSVSQGWYSIQLPDDLFCKVSPHFSDIRIIGQNHKKDTIEAPYILRVNKEKTILKEALIDVLNQSKNEKGHFYTFELMDQIAVNQLKLNFSIQNFDWKIKLEGSNDQNEWFIIVENYRLVSIKNEFTDYQFTQVNFPVSKYRYYRLNIPSAEDPKLYGTKIEFNEKSKVDYKVYNTDNMIITEDKETKTTIIDLTLDYLVPLASLKLNVADNIDYYRNIKISYLTDSIKTPKGYQKQYNTLGSGVLNSVGKNEFLFDDPLVQHLRIIIYNRDNTPLSINSLEAKGYQYELITRVDVDADYSLIYGNRLVSAPQYDLRSFTHKIPDTLTSLTLNEEITIHQEISAQTVPLFQNPLWLWAIMLLLIGLLGWFSYRMLKGEALNKQEQNR